MKANNILKTLFTCSVQEYNLGAHSSKSVVQRVNLVKKILDLIMRERRGREASKVVARLLVTKFRVSILVTHKSENEEITPF